MKKIVLLLLAMGAISLSAEARKVKGSVVSGEEKLSGVIVTDGTNFTQTKKNGKFSFEIKDDAEFVYIVTPAGYAGEWSTGVPAFFKRAEGVKKFTFDLVKTDTRGDYSIVAVGDPQPSSAEHFEIFAGEPLEDLSKTTNTLGLSAVGVALGDISWDKPERLGDWKREIVRTGIPFYPVIGNHDHLRKQGGDLQSSAEYRKRMCPENYAFFIGKDIFFSVDNIIYTAEKGYDEGYADHVLAFVRGVMKYVQADADVYIAQHSPLAGRDVGKRILGTSDMLNLIEGHKTLFLSGHNHLSKPYTYGNDVTEHNIASICGTWWDAYHCADGSPRGYKVYTKDSGKLTWYYKAIGQDRNFQVEIFKPGQTLKHPNSVIANVWDWDPAWKVEWYEDGKPMGKMEKVKEYSPYHIAEMKAKYEPLGKEPASWKSTIAGEHYFAATPSQYAKTVTVSVTSRFGQTWVYDVDMTDYVDVQAHRGGAGLMPENTIEAMKHALDLGVNTLELDLQISQDGQIVVSHDPYFHHRYAIRPDGSNIQKDDPKEYIYTMPYSEVVKYDVGSRPSEVWPEKACIKTVKPLASDLIDFVENYTKENGLSPVRYNIEIKSKDAKGEGQNWPTYDRFVSECCKLLHSKHLGDRLVVQSFDVRALNYMHEKYPEFILSYLVDAKAGDFDTFMAKLKFTPQWLSPHHSITDEVLVEKCREKGIRIVPWTVDKPEDIKRILDLKVEAIISNYPDRVLQQTRGYVMPVHR